MSLPVILMILGVVVVAIGYIFGARNVIGMIKGFTSGDMPLAADGFVRHIWAIAAVIIGFSMFVIGLVLAIFAK